MCVLQNEYSYSPYFDSRNSSLSHLPRWSPEARRANHTLENNRYNLISGRDHYRHYYTKNSSDTFNREGMGPMGKYFDG